MCAELKSFGPLCVFPPMGKLSTHRSLFSNAKRGDFRTPQFHSFFSPTPTCMIFSHFYKTDHFDLLLSFVLLRVFYFDEVSCVPHFSCIVPSSFVWSLRRAFAGWHCGGYSYEMTLLLWFWSLSTPGCQTARLPLCLHFCFQVDWIEFSVSNWFNPRKKESTKNIEFPPSYVFRMAPRLLFRG